MEVNSIAGAHNQIASNTFQLNETAKPTAKTQYDHIKEAQRNLSERQVANMDDVLVLMKDLEQLASNLPIHE